MKKIFGFTLAEVLITLGIIGIVAAMTIPSLITTYRKHAFETKLKQTMSIISQGFRLYIAEEGIDDLSDPSLPWKTNTDEFSKLISKYFKVSQDCNKKYMPCFVEYFMLYSNGKISKTSRKPYTCNVVVTLINGAALCFDAQNSGAVEDGGFGSLEGGLRKGEVIVGEIDINGTDPPNIGGYDVFNFSVDKNGHIFDAGYDAYGYNNENNSYAGALGKIIADGWKITYPIK